MAVVARAQTVVFVDASAMGTGDGTSWSNAFVHLQDALANAAPGDEIWITAGIYRPDLGTGITPGDREASFRIEVPVSLYGGFAGGETSRDDRDWVRNETILSGDLMANDSTDIPSLLPEREDNSSHVVIIELSPSEDPVRLDGLTIASGHAARGTKNTIRGGGIWQVGSHVEVFNSRIMKNLAIRCGGGWAMDSGSFHIGNTYFEGNRQMGGASSTSGGGAICAEALDGIERVLTIENSVFKYNSGFSGGALFTLNGSIHVSNSLFAMNESEELAVFQHEYRDSRLWGSPDFVPTAVYANNRFIRNRSGDDSMYFRSAWNAFIYNNIFIENDGIFSRYDEGTTIINSTFVRNGSVSGHNLMNNIFWKTKIDPYGILYVFNNIFDPDQHLGIIQNELIAGNNIVGNPLFVNIHGLDNTAATEDDDLRLSPDSPAIDRGLKVWLPADLTDLDRDGNREETLPVDLSMRARVFDDLLPLNSVDMGAYEFGAQAITIAVDQPEALPGSAAAAVIDPPYPNPTAGAVGVNVRVTQSVPGRVEVVDMLGRQRSVLFEGRLIADHEQTFTLDTSNLEAGVYLVVVRTPTGSTSRTVVVR